MLPFIAQAHAGDEIIHSLQKSDSNWVYFLLGITHIIPLGLDHILFVLTIFLLNKNLKSIIWQASAFTIAHSITLAMAMYQVISPPIYIVEPIIALSIFFVAAENIITDKLKPSRIALIFVFGLIHGMGFASVLTGLGLPADEFAFSLITFNLGVELGQIIIILLAWLLVGKWFSDKPWYRKRIVIPASALIALIGLYWTVERVFLA